MHKTSIFDLFNEQNQPAPEPAADTKIVKAADVITDPIPADEQKAEPAATPAAPAQPETVPAQPAADDAGKPTEGGTE